MGPSEQAYTIKQIGNWPNEQYSIKLDHNIFDPLLGIVPYQNKFLSPQNIGHQFGKLDNNFTDYNYGSVNTTFSPIDYKFKLDISTGDTLYWSPTSIRKIFNGRIVNIFYINLDPGERLIGYVLYPTRLFLKPISVAKTVAGWSLKTSAILLSATPLYFTTNGLSVCALDINQKYFENFDNKVEIPLSQSVFLSYSLSAVQKFSSRPVINYTYDYNPIYHNSMLESNGSKIKMDSVSLTNIHGYYDLDGTYETIGDPVIFKNDRRYYDFDSSLFFTDLTASPQIQSFYMLQSAANSNLPINASQNCMLSSIIDVDSTNFKYYANFYIDTRDPILNVSGVNATHLGVKYISDSPVFRNTLETVNSTIASFTNANIPNIFMSASASSIGADTTVWETTHPPHHYSYNLKFADNINFSKFTEESSLLFDLSSKIVSITSDTVVLSTYLMSEFGLMNLDLESYGQSDMIKFEFFDVYDEFVPYLSCYYGNSETPYSITNPQWVPANEGSRLRIFYPNSPLGEINISLTSHLSTYAGFLDSYYRTKVVLANGVSNEIVPNVKIFQNLIEEGSDYMKTTVGHLTSLSDFPLRDLSGSYISWSYEPTNRAFQIYTINQDNTYTLLPANSAVLFGSDTWSIMLSGYGPTTAITKLSSQKYNEVSLLSSTSSVFDIFREGKFFINPIKSLNNLDTVRNISLSAGIPYGNNIYPIPNDLTMFWTWEYDNVSNPINQPISSILLFNGNRFEYGDFGISNNLSAIEVFVKPVTDNFYPVNHRVKYTLSCFTASKPITGEYFFDVDSFPDSSVISADFYTYYPNITSSPIAFTKTSDVMTRPLDITSKYKFVANNDIQQPNTNAQLVWNVKDSLVTLSSLSGTPTMYHNITGARVTYVTLSALNCIAPGWINPHNISKTFTIYTIPLAEFNNPLVFNVYPEFFWNSGRNLTISDASNYTNSLAPTSYQNTTDNTYGFWLSANKTHGFDKYNYSIGNKTSSISLALIPYSTDLKSADGLSISLTAFGLEFPETNGIFYEASGVNGLFTNNFNLTAKTTPITIGNSQQFQVSPKIVPYTSCTFSFSATVTSLDVSTNRYITIQQAISTNPFESPTQPIGGTITYKLSSTYWVSEATVPAQNGVVVPFSLYIGDPFNPLYISDKSLNTLYLTASANIIKTIPETTFANYPSYNKPKALWSSIYENVSSNHIETFFAYTTSDKANIYVSDYYSLTGNAINVEIENYYLIDSGSIQNYNLDFGDGSGENLFNLGDSISHKYLIEGSYNITISSIYTDGSKIVYVNNQPITILNEWVEFNQDDIRFLDENILSLPYTLDQVYIQPNEFGNVDIFNSAITRLQNNLDYLKNNSKTINTESPSNIFGWLGTDVYNQSEGVQWHTLDYNLDIYANFDYAVSIGKTYFKNIQDFSEIRSNGDYVVIDDGDLKYFRSGKNPQEVSFINYDIFRSNFKNLKNISSNSDGTVLYISDNLNNKIHKVDLEISEYSYIFDTLDIGGFGDKKSTNRFNNPDKIVYRGNYVYVLDYNNYCIKKFTGELTWVDTFYVDMFSSDQIETFDVHPNGLLYVATKSGSVYILDTPDEVFDVINISNITGTDISDLSFDNIGEFFYVSTPTGVYKFSSSGVYIGITNIPTGTIRTVIGDGRNMFSVYPKYMLKWVDLVSIFKIGNDIDVSIWNLDKQLLISDEFASDANYNRSFQRTVQNVKKFRNSIESKMVLATETTSVGSVTYYAKYPVKVSERPVFSNDVEIENVRVGVNELHIPQVFNRELEKIYDAIELLRQFLNIKTINSATDNGCQNIFCWSWKAMSCYNLSLPVIKLCNINPITYAELKTSFGVSYAPTKAWKDAKSGCCNSVISPLM